MGSDPRDRRWLAWAILALLGTSSRVAAQSDIDDAHKHAWGESAGWLDWRGANGGADGVVVSDTFLSGYIWGENVGWIHVGDGTPGGGTSYANVDGSDYGVNIDVDGHLSGYAWGENIGWVNFDTAVVGAQRAVFDASAGRFRGYAWGENIGWINLDDATQYVAVAHEFRRGDADLDGDVDFTDAFVVLGYLFQGGSVGCQSALDYNDDESISISDATGVLCLLFCSGAPPPAPYPNCGIDPTSGGLSCASPDTMCP